MIIEPITNPIIDPIIDPLSPYGNPIIPPSLRPYVLAWLDSQKLNGMNNPTIAKWYDCSGNGRYAAMSNLAWTAGSNLDSTYGFSVDGVDDYGSIADSAATRLTTGGTLSAWIKPNTVGETEGRIFDKSSGGAAVNGYYFALASGNRVYAKINNGTSLLPSNNAITYGKWQFVCVTFNSSGRHLYVNGADVTLSGGAETALPPDVAGVVTIGNRTSGTDATFDGYIDKAAIINRVLSATEIRQLFQNSRRRYGL